MRTRATARNDRHGFTLAEVAVTIALMGMALVYMMQGLNAAKMTAAHTRNLKLSKELALLTLGRVQSGVYEDEIENDRLEGTYAEEGYPEFLFEVVIGEANFLLEVDEYGNYFDNWAHEREQRELNDDDEVAIVHGPTETGYRVASEAMVNIGLPR